MRIKFDKGLTPERIADHFVQIVRQNELVIGSVNIYIQIYDEEMKLEKFSRGQDYLFCTPSDFGKQEYMEDVAQIRRKKMKAAG